MKKIIYICILVLIGCKVSQPINSYQFKNPMLGEYNRDFHYDLYLLEDNKFSCKEYLYKYGCVPPIFRKVDNTRYEINGIYEMKDNYIKLIPQDTVYVNHTLFKEVITKIDTIEKGYFVDFKTEYQMFSWDKNYYLISDEEEFLVFINLYNSKRKPRYWDNSFYAKFYNDSIPKNKIDKSLLDLFLWINMIKIMFITFINK
jgi:hypothetical protein